MSIRPSTCGAIGGTVAALAVLAAVSLMLLNSGGANYKVLVAVWLWLLPVAGSSAVLGYAVGRIIEVIAGAKTSDKEGGSHGDAR